MTTLIKAIGAGKFLSKKSMDEQFQDLSKGLTGAPTQIGYGLGIAVAGNDWVLQNPVFNGYQGIAAYERGQKLSIVIDNTHGPNADPGTSIAAEIYKALADYLAPNDPIFNGRRLPARCRTDHTVESMRRPLIVSAWIRT